MPQQVERITNLWQNGTAKKAEAKWRAPHVVRLTRSRLELDLLRAMGELRPAATMFKQLQVHVHCVCIACAFVCALRVHCVCIACALRVHCVCTPCAHHVHTLCTPCALRVHCMCTPCALHVHTMCTPCARACTCAHHVHAKCTRCARDVHTAGRVRGGAGEGRGRAQGGCFRPVLQVPLRQRGPRHRCAALRRGCAHEHSLYASALVHAHDMYLCMCLCIEAVLMCTRHVHLADTSHARRMHFACALRAHRVHAAYPPCPPPCAVQACSSRSPRVGVCCSVRTNSFAAGWGHSAEVEADEAGTATWARRESPQSRGSRQWIPIPRLLSQPQPNWRWARAWTPAIGSGHAGIQASFGAPMRTARCSTTTTTAIRRKQC